MRRPNFTIGPIGKAPFDRHLSRSGPVCALPFLFFAVQHLDGDQSFA